MKINHRVVSSVRLLKMNCYKISFLMLFFVSAITFAQTKPEISYTTTNIFTQKTAISPLLVTNMGGSIPSEGNGTVQSVEGYSGYTRGLTVDNSTGNVFIGIGTKILKITPSGVLSTFAGNDDYGYNDGIGTDATFGYITSLALDSTGNLYVADMDNNNIRKITPEGVVTTLPADIHYPTAVAVDSNGIVYVAGYTNEIQKITPEGEVTTLAGSPYDRNALSTDGPGLLASFNFPFGLAVDANGNVYVADLGNRKIRKITPVGDVSTLAGSGEMGSTDGIGTAASFSYPYGVAVDANGNVYVADYDNSKIRKITPTGVVTTIAGSHYGFNDGAISTALFANPIDVAINAAGEIYVADSGNYKIRKISLYGYSVSPALPAGLVLNGDGSISGTPTVVSAAANYTITAYNEFGSSAAIINIAVEAPIATWNGTEWIDGPTMANAPAIIAGDYTSVGTLEVRELTIKNNVTVVLQSGHNWIINGKLTVDTGSTLTIENNANLIQTTNDDNSGTVTIKRNTAPLKRLDYAMWSTPIAGQLLQPFSATTLSTRFYTYNGATNKYVVVSAPASTAFEKGNGYLIRMPNDHPTNPTIWTGVFKGVPNNGVVSLVVTNGTYNAIGNPYPSAISAENFMVENEISEALYFWRKTNNAANPSYATYTLAGGVGTANSADPNGLIPNGLIQVGQGFIAKATSNAIVFNNAMRTASNANQFLKTKTLGKSRIWLNLTTASGFFSQTMVAYMDKATAGIDPAIDGRYFNDSQTALTSIINNEEFTIQGRALPFEPSDVVPLGFKTETAGDFNLAIDHTDGLFAAGQKVFLKDNKTNTVHDLSTGGYSFTSEAGVFNNRFEFRFQQALGTADSQLKTNTIVVYQQNETIKIEGGTQLIAGVKVYDSTGRVLVERKQINATTVAVTVRGARQMLFVQVTTQEGVVVTNKIIKQN